MSMVHVSLSDASPSEAADLRSLLRDDAPIEYEAEYEPTAQDHREKSRIFALMTLGLTDDPAGPDPEDVAWWAAESVANPLYDDHEESALSRWLAEAAPDPEPSLSGEYLDYGSQYLRPEGGGL